MKIHIKYCEFVFVEPSAPLLITKNGFSVICGFGGNSGNAVFSGDIKEFCYNRYKKG